MFGTKMRSVVKLADAAGVDAVVDQQFEVGSQILAAGLVPILEPEVDIHSRRRRPRPRRCSRRPSSRRLDGHPADQPVMFKLTLPEDRRLLRRARRPPEGAPGRRPLRRLRRDEANDRLARNPGVIASFSRALTEGLSAQQCDDEFDATLDATIKGIYEASIT